jgi:hypothetical protein
MSINFSKYLNGNPAMLEIWSDAMNRIEAGVELAPVQTIVVREWLSRARARKSELQIASQRDMLSDEKYAELAALSTQIEDIEIALRKFGT